MGLASGLDGDRWRGWMFSEMALFCRTLRRIVNVRICPLLSGLGIFPACLQILAKDGSRLLARNVFYYSALFPIFKAEEGRIYGMNGTA